MIERSASIVPGQGKIATTALNSVVARDPAFSLDCFVNAVPMTAYYNTPASDRHAFADSGKTMPQTTPHGYSDEDHDRADDRSQAASIWFPVPIAAVQVTDRVAPPAQNASIATGRSTATSGVANAPTLGLTGAPDGAETGVVPNGAKDQSESPPRDTRSDQEAATAGAAPPTTVGRQPAPSTAADIPASRTLGLEPPAPLPVSPDTAKKITPSVTGSSISVGTPVLSAPVVFVDAKFSFPGAPPKAASSGESDVEIHTIGVPIEISDLSPPSPGPAMPPVRLAVDPSASAPIASTIAPPKEFLLEQKAAAAVGNNASLTNTALPQSPIVTATPLAPRHDAVANALDIATSLPNRAGDDAGDDFPLSAPATAPMTASIATAVAANTSAYQVPLNLAQDTGLQRMIDHIELLRDEADSHDTRIRLSPDALGTVDVAVRKLGDSVHVHFTAQHDATRLVLANAHQRLSELATARGVKLSGSSVDIASQGGGNAGGGSQNNSSNSTLPPQTVVARSSSTAARSDPASISESSNQRLA